METITFNYSFGYDDVFDMDNAGHRQRSSFSISDEVLTVGEVVAAFEKFMTAAYGYTIKLDYDTHTDVSKQAHEE